MNIVITDAQTVTNGDLDLSVFEKYGNVTVYPLTSYEETKARIADADAVLLNKTVLDKETLSLATHLKYVGIFATGFNMIDLDYCREHGITVCNAGSYSTNAVAQHTFALILNHYNQIANYHAAVQDGVWERSQLTTLYDFPTDELDGKVIGLIGYGHIGKKVAEIARAFNMKVLVYTRTPKPDGIAEFVSFEELLANSDIISLHLPLNDSTRRMMDAEAFMKCKRGALLVNTARGGLVDEPALKAAVESGQLSGAALDAITVEPMRNCILKGVENIVITPHAAWAPMSTRLRLRDITTACLKAWMEGNPINVVSKL